MNNLAQDLRYAVRPLIKARGFAAVAILTLAFALGANTAIFSVVSAILLQPLPFTQPEELVNITGTTQRYESGPLSWLNLQDVKKQSRTLQHVAGYSSSSSFLYQGAEPERFYGALVTHDLFAVAAVKPHLGRLFVPKDDQPGAPAQVIISYDFWQR